MHFTQPFGSINHQIVKSSGIRVYRTYKNVQFTELKVNQIQLLLLIEKIDNIDNIKYFIIQGGAMSFF